MSNRNRGVLTLVRDQDHERKKGEVLWLEGPENAKSCQATQGCNVATTRRVVASNGTLVPVCQHCGSNVLIGEDLVISRPNLKATTVNAARAGNLYEHQLFPGKL